MEQERSKFDDLLQSCDLFDTPFDHTQFESDVTALREQLSACDKVHAYVGILKHITIHITVTIITFCCTKHIL